MAGPARLPRGIWILGFVSLFMDVSSELIHSLLPVFMVSVLGASVLAVGLIEGAAEGAVLIIKFFSNPFQCQIYTFCRVGDFQLATTYKGRAAQFTVPYPAKGVAKFIEKDDVDIMIHGKLYGVGGNIGSGSDHNAVHLFHGDLEGLFILFDLKAVAVFLEIRAVCVDYKLHNEV